MGNAGKAAYEAGDITVDVSNFRRTHLLLVHGLFDGRFILKSVLLWHFTFHHLWLQFFFLPAATTLFYCSLLA